MNNSPQILIGTLYCGENEFEEMKRSLQKQTYPYWKHIVLKNLPNKEAHDRLYRTFMKKAEQFELFIKLDADMVFQSSDALQQIARLFQSEDELDHAVLGVHDSFSDMLIIGMHVFTERCQWRQNTEKLFVDHNPEYPGRFVKLSEPCNFVPLVVHSPNPSSFQAYRFGVHRALKIVQHNRKDYRFPIANMQSRLVIQVWKRYMRLGIRELGLFVLGASDVVRTKRRHIFEEYGGKEVKDRFDCRYSSNSRAEIEDMVRDRWNTRVDFWRDVLSAVGKKRYLKARLASHLNGIRSKVAM